MLTHSAIALSNYDITEQLYSGSRTLVYRARRTADQQPAVIKVLRQEHPTFSELVGFRNQYTITKHLRAPGIIQSYSLEPYRNGYALVMEDFGGISLHRFAQGKPLCLNVFCPIALQIADILHHLYLNRIVHKDLKLANILINPDTQQVKLIDFSIASLLPRETPEIQNPNILEGTLAYLSPEQTGRMNRGIDYRSDFYSLGVTFFELLTGQLPFGSRDPMELVHCHLAKQPPSIHSLNPAIPPILSEIVAKLMAKNAEDRYQSALGLKHDLELCPRQYQEKGNYARFTLGQRDISDRFLIPERLYGREAEVVELLSAFNRVSDGKTELLLVAGFSGIGKTAVVNEVHKPIVRQRGYFIKGKYDQFNRNIPLSAFVQALRDLMGQLLCESDEQLAQWKDRILKALGENGQVAIEAIPELERIIGKQPPVPELSGSAAQNRFNLLFQKFIGVFAAKEHPLVMFLDDLQWADAASLNLMQVLMSQSEAGYLLLIGAYRDNEVPPVHPLMVTLKEIKRAIATVNTITLAALNRESLNALVADTLQCATEIAQPLTQLIHQKTKGNPFFTTQLLKALHGEGWIAFEARVGHWQCDIAQVRSLCLTDDVVEFMALQLQKLPAETQDILKLAACIGNQFDLATLAIVSEQPETEAAANLWKALQEGLILPQSEIYKFYQADGHRESGMGNGYESIPSPITHSPLLTYKFLHDRVQQAAYSLIPEAQKGITHLRIGQLLLGGTRIEEREEKVFKIVSQLNQGSHLITRESQREELTQLNLMAAQKAKGSTAYAAAKEYLAKGFELLSSDCWQNQYLLAKALSEVGAEVNYLSGDYETANKLIDIALQKSDPLLERIKLYQVRIQISIAKNQLAEVTNLSLKVLQELGVFFPEKITSNDVQQAIDKTRYCIFDRSREELLNQPEMDDSASIAIMELLMLILPTAYFTNINLLVLMLSKTIEISIQKGRLAWSPYAYAGFGFMLVDMDGIEEGYLIGKLALDMVYHFNYKTVKSRVLEVFNGHIRFWKEHLQCTVQSLLEGYQAGVETGDLEYASYSALMYCYHSYFLGNPLSEVAEEMKKYEVAIQKLGQSKALYWHQIYHQPVLNLLGRVDDPCVLTGEACDENQTIELLRSNQEFNSLGVLYINKLNLCYLFESYALALEAGNQGASYVKNLSATPTIAIYYLYDSLVKLAVCPELASSNPTGYAEYLANVEANQAKMQNWAARAPMNFQHKYDLVEAERYRVLNQRAEAVDLYDRAIALAKANKYTQEEALANELAAKFYLDWGKERIAQEYMTEAYYCYARWGAKAKIADLETRYPQLLAPILQQARCTLSVNETVFPSGGGTSTSSSSSSVSDSLDLAAILKASQTLSGEIELDKLFSTLLQLIVENAGAHKCVLLLVQSDRLSVKGLATVGAQPVVLQRIPVEESQDIPLKLIYAVKNRLEPVVLMDATAHAQFASDPYVVRQQPKSILCSPILHQGKLLGIAYLENNLTIGAFNRDRVHILNVLCAQAAISLENARLYQRSQDYAQELEQSLEKLRVSEARFQKLADNLPGMIYQLRMAPDGTVSTPYISSGCAALYEVPPVDFLTGIRDLRSMEHPDDRAGITQAIAHSAQTLTPFEREFRICTRSGSVKWIQAASRPEPQADGSIVWDGVKMDISDRKQTQIELQKSQQLLQLVMDSIPQLIFWKDRNFVYQGCNSNFAKAAGIGEIANIVGKTDYDLPWKQEESDWFRECDRRIVSTNTPEFHIIEPQLQTNGKQIWADTCKIPLQDAEGNVVGILGTYEDITERKQAELELQKLAAVVENSTDFISIATPDGQALYVNLAGRRLVGLDSTADILSLHMSDFHCPEDLAQIQQTILPQTAQEGFIQVELHLQHFITQEQIPVDYGIFVINDSQTNQPLYLAAICRDIRDRKRAEASLAKERELLNAIIHNITDGIVVCDADGNLILFNNAMREFHGLPVASLPPEQWAEYFALYQPDGKTLLSTAEIPLFRALQGEIVENAEILIAPKQGSTRFLLASGQAIVDPAGNKIGAVVAMRDISDRKAAELAIQQKSQALEDALTNLQQAQLQIIQSEKMSALGNLVAGVAHEINNPIGFISGNLQPALDYVKDTFGLIDLYQQEYPTPSAAIQEEMEAIDIEYVREDLPKLIGSMQLGVDRICSISTSLRTFSRADKDYKVPFNIHEGIDSTILILKHRLKASESRPAIEVETEYGNIPILECFPGQLNQVFMNLLANAIDTLEESSQKRTFGDIAANPNRIEIQTGLDDSGKQVIIYIRDNGMGMSDEVKQRVFDHLFTTKAVGKGTGLGLAIARQIVVEKHGGAIAVNSTAGMGTEFTIALPVKANGSA